MLTAVDPGLRGCGCALFSGGVLVSAGYSLNIIGSGRGPNVHAAMARQVGHTWHSENLVIEFPRIYPHGPKDRRSDPNDLLDVAGVAGGIAALFKTVTWVFPQEWKGQVPKEIMNRRVIARLSSEEVSKIISVGAKDHNTIDAIGIGLFHLGRLK